MFKITGKHEMVEALISLGSDLNSSDYHGATPLHLAAQEGNQSAIVSFFVLFEPDVVTQKLFCLHVFR